MFVLIPVCQDMSAAEPGDYEDPETVRVAKRCGTFTLRVRAGRRKNYQADNLRCDPEEVFIL